MSNSEQIEGVPAQDLANAIRALAMDAVEKAKSGHPGMPMGMADAATVLFSKFLKYDPSEPNWASRQRLARSAKAWPTLSVWRWRKRISMRASATISSIIAPG